MTQRAKPGTPLADRFWMKVRKTDDCWYWTGAIDSGNGYGRIAPDKSGKSANGPSLFAHRVSYELAHGPIPEGLCVLHHCDNRVCVNPDHLFLGSKADNNRDMTAKGRHGHATAHGESNFNAKLTDDLVRSIRSIYRKGDREYGTYGLARKFGVTQSTIQCIIDGRTWRHVT